MKKILYIFSLILTLLYTAYGQEPLSVHELQKKEFGSQTLHKSLFSEDGRGIIPLQLDKAQSSSAVFGYLPYWEYSSEKDFLQYDLLTHIACFDFQADAAGGLSKPSYWPWTDVINQAHLHGVKVIMCVTNFTGSQITSLISTETSKQNLFSNIRNMIRQYSLDGVNIDFEGVLKADRGSAMNSFMTELSDTIHNALPGKEVSFAGPVINWGGWDLLGLAKACDYIFVMGYDFYGAWSKTSGPGAPLYGNSQTDNITSALSSTTYGYGNVIPAYSQKLILGVPYYGNRWQVDSDKSYAKAVKFVRSMLFRDEAFNAQKYGLKWDISSQTPWYCYKQDSVTWVQDWFDSDSSIGLKYSLAALKKLKGVGMWALGQDGSRTELWDLLRKHVVADVKDAGNTSPAGFALRQNYPNPFNPSTVINYEIPVTSKVTLSVYDILGREVAVLFDGEKSPGTYSQRFDGSTFQSGVYLYRLVSGSFSAVKKFILIK
ncbi:MAG TPA: glycosyl hydrolase family 18 protein [Ignavibacteriales bacterium]|nr:glycosyl hydrolase family 18 protein [Ignavibacteriales bacterium]